MKCVNSGTEINNPTHKRSTFYINETNNFQSVSKLKDKQISSKYGWKSVFLPEQVTGFIIICCVIGHTNS